MGRLAVWCGAAAVGGLVMTGSVGCVSSKEFHNVEAQRDAALMQRDEVRVQATGFRADAEAFRMQLGAVSADSSSKDVAMTQLSNDNAELRNQLSDINTRYSEAMDSGPPSSNGPSPGNLPTGLKEELSAFCAKNKDVVEFDSSKCIVRFKSDAAFSPGSSDLTPKGKAAAKSLASVLSSKDGAGFELMIAGHTDSTPISKASTIQKGNKDNWYLSAHRAIAVGEVLQGNHVHPKRLAMVGYADQHPVASNASDSGRSQNRRVEVLVLGTKVSAKDLAMTPASKSSGKSSSKSSLSKNASADASWNK